MEIVTFRMNKTFETSAILCNYHMPMGQIFNRQNYLSCRKRPPELNILVGRIQGLTVLFFNFYEKKIEKQSKTPSKKVYDICMAGVTSRLKIFFMSMAKRKE